MSATQREAILPTGKRLRQQLVNTCHTILSTPCPKAEKCAIVAEWLRVLRFTVGAGVQGASREWEVDRNLANWAVPAPHAQSRGSARGCAAGYY